MLASARLWMPLRLFPSALQLLSVSILAAEVKHTHKHNHRCWRSADKKLAEAEAEVKRATERSSTRINDAHAQVSKAQQMADKIFQDLSKKRVVCVCVYVCVCACMRACARARVYSIRFILYGVFLVHRACLLDG